MSVYTSPLLFWRSIIGSGASGLPFLFCIGEMWNKHWLYTFLQMFLEQDSEFHVLTSITIWEHDGEALDSAVRCVDLWLIRSHSLRHWFWNFVLSAWSVVCSWLWWSLLQGTISCNFCLQYLNSTRLDSISSSRTTLMRSHLAACLL